MVVAIIGGGCSGVLLAMQLYRAARNPMQILIFEKNANIAQGIAYATELDAHLLNVAAGNMSIYVDKPDDFIDWIQNNPHATPYVSTTKPLGEQFLPRRLYGEYLQQRLQACLQSPSPHGAMILIHTQEVVGLTFADNQQVIIHTASGASYTADKTVLATGNLLPREQFPHLPTTHYINNPWDAQRLTRIAPEDTVLISGTGLTMIDVILSLKNNQHRAPIYAVSRHGLIPHAHGEQIQKYTFPNQEMPTTLTALMRYIRNAIDEHQQQGGHWQAVINALRPFSHAIWKALSTHDRRRFLRHVFAYWNIHRHRLPHNVAATIQQMQDDGQLKIIPGKILELTLDDKGMTALIKQRATKNELPKAITAQTFINCTGPNGDYRKTQSALYQGLLAQGMIRPDNMCLGLNVTEQGEVIGKDGDISRSLFALGSLCKGLHWEITAVPDIRQQCQLVAAGLLAE